MSSAAPAPGHSPHATTGRYLVYFAEEATSEGTKILDQIAGLRVATQSEKNQGSLDLDPGEAMVFANLGVAVVFPGKGHAEILETIDSESASILSVEHDRVLHAIPIVVSQISSEDENTFFKDYGNITWGLKATMIEKSKFSGKGVRLAVLDTGLDLQHPDFKGRQVVTKSFVPKQSAQDMNGHGTHCIGTACGPTAPMALPRYGIASDCDLFAGKIMNDAGIGSDAEMLAGISWAFANKCRVISLSVATPVQPGEIPSVGLDTMARRLLNGGTMIVAAAGNDSNRNMGRTPMPVSHPANCQSVMAVGAVDIDMKVANFSNGGSIDFVAPGVHVHSSVPSPTLYRAFSGTSMAAPHVSGIAALWAEKHPKDTGHELWGRLIENALRLKQPSRDVGAGLVQAP